MVIVGGGFAGLFAARILARAPVQSLANLTKHNIGQLPRWSRPNSGGCSTGPASSTVDGFLAKTRLDLGNPHN